MKRLLFLTLAVLCWVDASWACGGCGAKQGCSGGNTAACCTWDDPLVDTDPASYGTPGRTPLGFTIADIPDVETGGFNPCVTVPISDTGRQTYIQIAVESNTPICVWDVSDNTNAISCGSVTFACDPDGYKGDSSPSFRFECIGTGCETNVELYFRVNMETLDNVDEYWCDNANMTIPSELSQGTNTAFTPSDITRATVPASASFLIATPVLLIVSVLIATLSL